MKRLVLAVAIVATMGCGYALAGKGGSLPPKADGTPFKRIGVPLFVNQTGTPELDQIVTTAVRQELQSKGRYQVLPDDTGVDAVLSGTLLNMRSDAMGITEARQAARYLIRLTASVEFKETNAKAPFWLNPSFRMAEEYDVPSGTGATDQTLVFQADRQALERLAKSFARSLISQVFEGM
jgi:outer membrane lipopolysaccharide assembly protein LptE/RlpB